MNSIKTPSYATLLSFVLGLMSFSVSAQSERPVPSISKQNHQIIQAVTRYGSAIGCLEQAPTQKDIVVMSPLKSMRDREDAKFTVTWIGDIGCQGAPGTTLRHIAVVRIGASDTFYVDAMSSEPYVDLRLPTRIEKVGGGAENTIVVEALDYRDSDSHCCPTLRKRYTIKLLETGKWKTIATKRLPSPNY